MAVKGLIATAGIELLTWAAPNGHKISILLEELKEAYGKSYTYQTIDIRNEVQKQAWFTTLGLNGRLPVIVDHDRDDFAVQESGAILHYLTRRYDPENRFSFDVDSDDYSRSEQWISWQFVLPVNIYTSKPVQCHNKSAYTCHLRPESPAWVPYKDNQATSSDRLQSALLILRNDTSERLSDYSASWRANSPQGSTSSAQQKGRHTIADITCYGWINRAYISGLDLSQCPNLDNWHKRISERPAVKKGTEIANPRKITNDACFSRLENEPGV